MANIRTERINAEIAKAVSKIVSGMNDPRLTSMVTISSVDTTSDLSFSKIKIGVLNNAAEQKEILAVLVKSKGYIRHELASVVRLRKMPELVFELDEGFTHSTKINEILKTLDLPKEEETEENE